MTVFEHAMVGISLGLAAGLDRRFGSGVLGISAVAAVLPDWDGLSILFGSEAYATAHRRWGHNLLAASIGGVLVAGLEYRYHIAGRVRRWLDRRFAGQSPRDPVPDGQKSSAPLAVCLGVGLVAAYSHLAADLVYSAGPGMHTWALPLLWPFSDRAWALPTVPWGDVGATLIFAAEMFVLYRWPRRAQSTAWLTLVAVAAYVGIWRIWGAIPAS